MADGFLGRWSRRKADVREGRPAEPEPPRAEPPVPAAPPSAVAAEAPVAAPAEPPPTMDEVQALTPESDFRRFAGRDVAPDVKNAALKKLFADPRYNIQDGLDVYIDDYNKPDPLPEAMLRRMAGAKILGLFREEDRKDEPGDGAREGAEGKGNASVAQSGPVTKEPPGTAPPANLPPDAHPDLRLQQDDAAEGGEPGRGAG